VLCSAAQPSLNPRFAAQAQKSVRLMRRSTAAGSQPGSHRPQRCRATFSNSLTLSLRSVSNLRSNPRLLSLSDRAPPSACARAQRPSEPLHPRHGAPADLPHPAHGRTPPAAGGPAAGSALRRRAAPHRLRAAPTPRRAAPTLSAALSAPRRRAWPAAEQDSTAAANGFRPPFAGASSSQALAWRGPGRLRNGIRLRSFDCGASIAELRLRSSRHAGRCEPHAP
jgi:hypothetical protein